jgi:hypothetical protein
MQVEVVLEVTQVLLVQEVQVEEVQVEDQPM